MLEEKLTAGILGKNTPCVFQSHLVGKIVNYIHRHDLDIFLGPEWLFCPNSRFYTKEEKEEIITEIADRTKDRDTLIIPGSIMWEDDDYFYNTAPLISKGKAIGEYHKHISGGNLNMATERNCKKERYYNEKRKAETFKWKGYDIGVEICADFGDLYDALEEEKKPFMDLFFLVSCGVDLFFDSTKIPIKDNCYALNSDGYEKKVNVIQRIKKKDKIIDSKKKGNLYLYELILHKE